VVTPKLSPTVYSAADMIAPLGRRPEDAWLSIISNRNG
jgi:hypothetical protein